MFVQILTNHRSLHVDSCDAKKKTSHGYHVKCKQGFNLQKNQLIKIIAVDNCYGTINVLSRKKTILVGIQFEICSFFPMLFMEGDKM